MKTEREALDGYEQSVKHCIRSTPAPWLTREIVLDQPSQLPPIDARVEKITNQWGCGFGLIGLMLFIVFIIMMDVTERTTYKFYNFQPDMQPSLTLTVKREYAVGFEVYRLPPIPYKHRLELSIPTPERRSPIQIQFSMNHQTQCVKLEKEYGIWEQMDAIWITSDGSIDAYAADYCKKIGRYDCRFIPDYVNVFQCGVDDNDLLMGRTKQNSSQDVHIKIKPMNAYDFRRLREKKGINFE